MQSIDSKRLFWEPNSERPFSDLQADDDSRTQLASTYFFRPNPSVRRVVTIGTPHRGSRFSNDFTGWLGRKLIAAPMRAMQGRQQLFAKNPGFFRPGSPISVRTSIESLAPTSPMFAPLLSAEPGPWISYHNIIGHSSESGLGKVFGAEGDGVVSLTSARLDDSPQVKSQLVVPSDHLSVHRHPQSILEVRRILMEQVVELETLPFGGDMKVQVATQQEPLPRVRIATVPEPAAPPAARPWPPTPTYQDHQPAAAGSGIPPSFQLN